MYVILLAFCIVSTAFGWAPVAPGVEYQSIRLTDPNDIFIVRVDRASSVPIIDTTVANERVKGAREKTTSMYARYNDSLTTWENGLWSGLRYKTVAAVNGYYFNMNTGEWISGGIANGWYVHRFDDMVKKAGYGSGYGIRHDRSVFIGECVSHPATKNYIVVSSKGSEKIAVSGINVARKADSLMLYTPQYDLTTKEATTGIEIVVELPGPLGISSDKKPRTGVVKEVRKNKGSTIIPFDAVVLSAEGTKAVSLEKVAVGDKVEFHQDMEQFDEATCSKPVGNIPWENTYSSLGGAFHYLKDGKREIYKDTIRHPRTAMAYNKKYIYFYVVDGRTAKSRGMTIDELSEFAMKHLEATDGIALDGGGSSTIVIDGQIKNFPSDGVERTVTNAVVISVPVPREVSKKLAKGDKVSCIKDTEIRVGPGTSFHAIGSVKANSAGTVVDHGLAGIRAKGTFWWKVKTAETEGWIDERDLKKT